MSNKPNLWSELTGEVYNRLCDCRSKKDDIVPLARSVFHNNIKGFTAEDSLVYVLEHLECNSQDFDLTKDEFNEYIEQIGA